VNIFGADTERNCDSNPLYVERRALRISAVGGFAENPVWGNVVSAQGLLTASKGQLLSCE
jgi:hypothetical protein